MPAELAFLRLLRLWHSYPIETGKLAGCRVLLKNSYTVAEMFSLL